VYRSSENTAVWRTNKKRTKNPALQEVHRPIQKSLLSSISHDFSPDRVLGGEENGCLYGLYNIQNLQPEVNPSNFPEQNHRAPLMSSHCFSSTTTTRTRTLVSLMASNLSTSLSFSRISLLFATPSALPPPMPARGTTSWILAGA
jgi:hypothetical protein